MDNYITWESGGVRVALFVRHIVSVMDKGKYASIFTSDGDGLEPPLTYDEVMIKIKESRE